MQVITDTFQLNNCLSFSVSHFVSLHTVGPKHIHQQQTMPTSYCCLCLPLRCSWRCMLLACPLTSCLSSIALTALWCPLVLRSLSLSTWASCQSWASLCCAAYACSVCSKSPGEIAFIKHSECNLCVLSNMVIIHHWPDHRKSSRIFDGKTVYQAS